MQGDNGRVAARAVEGSVALRPNFCCIRSLLGDPPVRQDESYIVGSRRLSHARASFSQSEVKPWCLVCKEDRDSSSMELSR